MFGWLLLLFTVVPLWELWLLLRIGHLLGAGPTIALVLVTGLVGAAFARTQGVAVMRELQRATAEGRLPAAELLQGALVLVGGVLLVTPGVTTDVVGLLLLVPPTRRLAARRLTGYLRRRIEVRSVGFHEGRRAPPGTGARGAAPPTVDVDWREAPPEEARDGEPPER